MKTVFILLLSTFFSKNSFEQSAVNNLKIPKEQPDKIVFITGGNFDTTFIKYVATLTNKPNPRVCFLPTASADNIYAIAYWFQDCAALPLKPFVMRTFINSSPEQKTFEEELLSYDAIIVGGGSTLNMLAIWRAQGIDTVLRKAYDKGIILAGGSAGSLCWFTGGYTDSRPKQLSLTEGLGILNYSHSAHYHGEPARRPLYLQALLAGKLTAGYACDDNAGLLFVNGIMTKSVSLNPTSNNYFVSVVNGKISEELLPAEIIK